MFLFSKRYSFSFPLLFLLLLVSCKQSDKDNSKNPITKDSSFEQANDSSLFAQNLPLTPADPFILNYQGAIGGKNPITMTLINWGNGMVDGYYFYNKHKKNIELFGEIELDETLYLTEYSNEGPTGHFKGKFSDVTQYRGTWMNEDSTREMEFSVEQVSPVPDLQGWTGAWHLNNAYDDGILIIGNVMKDQFDFALSVFRGSHNGVISGNALYQGKEAEFKKTLSGEDEACEIAFRHRGDFIELEQFSSSFACEFGLRAYADGKYEKEKREIKPTFEYGEPNHIFPTKTLHDVFKETVGDKFYEVFAFNMQLVEEKKVNEPEYGISAICWTGGVAGLFTINEAIIMHNGRDTFWAATLYSEDDFDDPTVRYFTNDPDMKKSFPKPFRGGQPGFRITR